MARENLFGLEAGDLASRLAEANAALLARRDALLAALDRVPDPLPDGDAAARALRFAGQLRATLGEARSAKMADSAPLRGAQKAVDGFFDEVSRPLQRALAHVEALLTQAATPLQEPLPPGLEAAVQSWSRPRWPLPRPPPRWRSTCPPCGRRAA
jgi:hypothetical protein